MSNLNINPEYERLNGRICKICGHPCYETNGLYVCKCKNGEEIFCGNDAPENAEEIKFDKN